MKNPTKPKKIPRAIIKTQHTDTHEKIMFSWQLLGAETVGLNFMEHREEKNLQTTRKSPKQGQAVKSKGSSPNGKDRRLKHCPLPLDRIVQKVYIWYLILILLFFIFFICCCCFYFFIVVVFVIHGNESAMLFFNNPFYISSRYIFIFSLYISISIPL